MYITTYDHTGDPADLMRRYHAMLEDIGSANLLFHAAGPTDTGIRIIDACPSREVHDAFVAGPFPAMLAKHGIPQPTCSNEFVADVALANGTAVQVPA